MLGVALVEETLNLTGKFLGEWARTEKVTSIFPLWLLPHREKGRRWADTLESFGLRGVSCINGQERQWQVDQVKQRVVELVIPHFCVDKPGGTSQEGDRPRKPWF